MFWKIRYRYHHYLTKFYMAVRQKTDNRKYIKIFKFADEKALYHFVKACQILLE